MNFVKITSRLILEEIDNSRKLHCKIQLHLSADDSLKFMNAKLAKLFKAFSQVTTAVS